MVGSSMIENQAEKVVRRIWSFSRALDLALVDEEVSKGLKLEVGYRHGESVGYISLRLGYLMGFRGKDLLMILIAGLIHDIGAVGGFDDFHGDYLLMKRHSDLGAEIVKNFPDGKFLEEALRYHHASPAYFNGERLTDENEIPLVSKIISLADSVDIIIGRKELSYEKKWAVINRVHNNSGKEFFPEVAEVFAKLAQEEAFWLDLYEGDMLGVSLDFLFGCRGDVADCEVIELSEEILKDKFIYQLAETFAFLIDQKSSFTAKHSLLVAEMAVALAEQIGWPAEEIREIKTAGLLHDLGKLAVPRKILDKPGSLDKDEFQTIRSHTYYTFALLSAAGFPRKIVEWAAYHHERLDGNGYPFRISEHNLDTGARLMTIADIYAALTEDRPYRAGMPAEKAMTIIEKGINNSVDGKLVQAAKKVLL